MIVYQCVSFYLCGSLLWFYLSLAEYGVIDCTSPSPDYHDQQRTLNCNGFTHYHLLLSLIFLAPPGAQKVALSVCVSVIFRISSLNLQSIFSSLLVVSLYSLSSLLALSQLSHSTLSQVSSSKLNHSLHYSLFIKQAEHKILGLVIKLVSLFFLVWHKRLKQFSIF